MKKTLTLITLLSGVAASTIYGQGTINFNNYANPGVRNTSLAGAPLVGSDYRAALYWAPGANQPIGSLIPFAGGGTGSLPFLGATGGGPATDGAGWFDGGTLNFGDATLTAVTLQVRAWRTTDPNVTGFANALYSGSSSLFNDTLSQGVALTQDALVPAFTVQIVPEPSTLALLGLGTGALLFFRRRK